MIYLVSDRDYPAPQSYKQVPIEHFFEWSKGQAAYQLDIETNNVDDILQRELYTVQIGSTDLKHQYVFDYAGMKGENRERLTSFLDDRSRQKLIHFALFEYPVFKHRLGIDIANIYDTFLALKVLLNGKNVPEDIFQLQGAVREYLGVQLDKSAQTSFNGEILSTGQIIYAALDVYYLAPLINYIKQFEQYPALEQSIRLHNEVVRAFGDILYHGFVFDKNKWEKNLDWARPQVDEAKQEVFKWMKGEDIFPKASGLGFIRENDELCLNWKSTNQKTLVLKEIYPGFEKYTKPTLKVIEKTLPDGNLLEPLLENDYQGASDFVLKHHKPLLEKLGFLKKAGEVTINLNSPQQRLKLFQIVEPGIPDTKAETLENYSHPMIKAYSTYIKRQKMVQSYGENFYAFIGGDGRIRCQYADLLLATGRVSIKSPPLQTIPADEGYYVGSRYREAFKPQEGWSIVASDFISQELAIIGYLAGEESWIEAIRKGHDLHSKNAARMFGTEWTAAGGDPLGIKKPKSLEAIKLRDYSKAISFGLAYGAGPGLVASRLGIPVTEAAALIYRFFLAFPKIKKFLDEKAEFGKNNGYIDIGTGFYNARRYFTAWNEWYVTKEDLASIGRKSKNTCIQGGGAIATKCAMVLIKNYIEGHRLQDRARILFMLHDEVICEARDDFANEWAPIMTNLMEEGHNYLTPGNLVKAETKISKSWTK